MTSHGVPRVTQVEDKTQQAREKEQLKIGEYMTLVDALNRRIQNDPIFSAYNAIDTEVSPGGAAGPPPPPPVTSDGTDADPFSSTSTMDLTTRILKWNPEYNTVWNHRRRLLLARFAEGIGRDELARILRADLAFLVPLLVKFPKCYWMWNYRWWLLQQASSRLAPDSDEAGGKDSTMSSLSPEDATAGTKARESGSNESHESARRFWTDELGLVTKMLARDSRNFHAWGYRQKVVAELEKMPPTTEEALTGSRVTERMQREINEALGNRDDESEKQGYMTSMAQEELDYTTRMINTNLSNYSAWHYRSKLIPRLLDEKGASNEERKIVLGKELDLILSALYTDPDDASIWSYHTYLLTSFSNPPSVRRFAIAPNLSERERSNGLDAEIEKTLNLLAEEEQGAVGAGAGAGNPATADGPSDAHHNNNNNIFTTSNSRLLLQNLAEMGLMYRRQGLAWNPRLDRYGALACVRRLGEVDPLRKGRWDAMDRQILLFYEQDGKFLRKSEQ